MVNRLGGLSLPRKSVVVRETDRPGMTVYVYRGHKTTTTKNLNVTKACGLDLLSPRLLKESEPILARPLSFFHNRLLQSSYFPIRWNRANVSPIFKKDDKSIPSNYRPVSLLSYLGNPMERCVHKHLYNLFPKTIF